MRQLKRNAPLESPANLRKLATLIASSVVPRQTFKRARPLACRRGWISLVSRIGYVLGNLRERKPDRGPWSPSERKKNYLTSCKTLLSRRRAKTETEDQRWRLSSWSRHFDARVAGILSRDTRYQRNDRAAIIALECLLTAVHAPLGARINLRPVPRR